jgi:PIN domain nuclease of toxin-antitoxin system
VSSSSRIDKDTRDALAAPDNEVFVSSVTVWEIAIKRAARRLVFPIDQLDEIGRRMGFEMLPIQPAHAIVAGSLPRHHADPFDRMLIAQAIVENLTLVTSDSLMARYDVRILSAAHPSIPNPHPRDR